MSSIGILFGLGVVILFAVLTYFFSFLRKWRDGVDEQETREEYEWWIGHGSA